ncbi:hypothetical protein RRG08_060471 [Elysia crispata]|uniref:Uncharacterized protein n=1 Tax=Elysia crispata TaxID=231223 RepID=A0AAE1B232_9GAST|nr:hypothetical protein RRG08_060471 [Elysia crispata]
MKSTCFKENLREITEMVRFSSRFDILVIVFLWYRFLELGSQPCTKDRLLCAVLVSGEGEQTDLGFIKLLKMLFQLVVNNCCSTTGYNEKCFIREGFLNIFIDFDTNIAKKCSEHKRKQD